MPIDPPSSPLPPLSNAPVANPVSPLPVYVPSVSEPQTSLPTFVPAASAPQTALPVPPALPSNGVPLEDRILALEQAFLQGGNVYVPNTDPRLTDAREWTAITITQNEAEAGNATQRRAWTAERVRQAIDALAAKRILTITNGPFQAVVGGRYITESATTIQINDPATRPNGSALMVGDSYEIWVGSGAVQFNAAGTVFQPSRFSIRRRWNGVAWMSPLPVLSDPIAVGSGMWNGSTFTGPQSFSSQVELTNQSAANPTSPMTRALADARYGGQVLIARKTANTPRTSTITRTADPHLALTLDPGTYIVELNFQYFCASGVPGINTELRFTGTASQYCYQTFRGATGAAGSVFSYPDNSQTFGASTFFGVNQTNQNGWHRIVGSFVVGTTGVLQLEWAQSVSSVDSTTAGLGSFLKVQRIA